MNIVSVFACFLIGTYSSSLLPVVIGETNPFSASSLRGRAVRELLWTRCDCAECDASVLNTMADGHSCDERINWVQNTQHLSEREACMFVAGQDYPNECGSCNPDTCDTSVSVGTVSATAATNTACGCSTCTETVFDNDAGEYKCGDRIEYLQNHRGYSEQDACVDVAEEFQAACGECNPDTCNNNDEDNENNGMNNDNEVLLGGGASNTIVAMHWNPHWENDEETKKVIDGLLVGKDFVNLVMFEDTSWYPTGNFEKVYDGRHCVRRDSHNNNVASSDTIVYDSSKWDTVGDYTTGCLENSNDRPYLVQRFRNKSDNTYVTVAGAHFPHGDDAKWATLGPVINDVSEGGNVIFMGDTNDIHRHPNSYFFDRWGLDTTVSSYLDNTCCHNSNYGDGPYDRVIANFGSNSDTTMLGEVFTPIGAYHKPIILEFNY